MVHTVPRGGESGSAPPLTLDNLPPFVTTPRPENEITVSSGVVSIPD